MEWKDFFRPDWRKFILFIIIVIIERTINTFILGYYLVYGIKLPSILIITPFDILNRMMIPILVTPGKTPLIQLSFDTLIGGLTQLLNILWQYFLACLVIFIYYNIKKRKTKETKKKKARK